VAAGLTGGTGFGSFARDLRWTSLLQFGDPAAEELVADDMERDVYAHSLPGRPRDQWERLEAHSRLVAEGATANAAPFGYGNLARVAGLLHDIGKA